MCTKMLWSQLVFVFILNYYSYFVLLCGNHKLLWNSLNLSYLGISYATYENKHFSVNSNHIRLSANWVVSSVRHEFMNEYREAVLKWVIVIILLINVLDPSYLVRLFLGKGNEKNDIETDAIWNYSSNRCIVAERET